MRQKLLLSLLLALTAGEIWRVLLARPDRVAPAPRSTRQWLERHAAGEAVLGLGGPPAARNPIREQAEALILGPAHPDFSTLWLQALGVSHLLTPDAGKFAWLLENEYQDEAGYRVYRVPVRRPGAAVLVSRRQWRALPRLQSLYDRAALLAYLEWANRPEPARFRPTSDGRATVEAELGPDDMMLLRQDFGSGWRATLDGQPIEARADPIGLLLLDAARTGRVEVVLQPPGDHRPAPRALPTHAVPYISEGGVRDGVRHTPPPFPPGAIVSIYGVDLGGEGETSVLAGGQPAEVLWAGPRQVNVRLPAGLAGGPTPVVVEFRGGRSNSVRIEIQP